MGYLCRLGDANVINYGSHSNHYKLNYNTNDFSNFSQLHDKTTIKFSRVFKKVSASLVFQVFTEKSQLKESLEFTCTIPLIKNHAKILLVN